MRTARSSSRPGGRLHQAPPKEQTPPPSCGQNHRSLWKYNLNDVTRWHVVKDRGFVPVISKHEILVK